MRQNGRSAEPPSTVARPGALRALLALTGLTAVSVLIQAALAGQFLNVNYTGNLQKVHGQIGNITFLLAIGQVIAVLAAGIIGRMRSSLLGMTITLVVLVTIQLGLGYSGRDRDSFPSALHVPNGVLIFGVTMANISMALRAIRETENAG